VEDESDREASSSEGPMKRGKGKTGKREDETEASLMEEPMKHGKGKKAKKEKRGRRPKAKMASKRYRGEPSNGAYDNS
jgi:hypothetical protein